MRYTKIYYLQILCLVLLVNANERNQAKQLKKRGVVDNFGEGLKLAGQVFGINTAADVANLVAMAFAEKKKPDFMSMFQQQQTNDGDSEPDASQQDQSAQEQQASNVKNGQRQKQQQQDESDEQSKEPTPFNSEFSTKRFVTGVLRMIGFDATKLGALAINALIMIAQAIGNALTTPTRRNVELHTPSQTHYDSEDEGEPEAPRQGAQEAHQPRALREGTPIDWYLENPNAAMRRLLGDALDTELTDRITEMIERVEEQENGQVGCIKLLMCKSSPIIWGMQRSVSERVTGKAANTTDDGAKTREKPRPKKLFSTEVFFSHFPTIEEFRKHGVVCDERFHKQCNLDQEGDGNAEQTQKPKKQ